MTRACARTHIHTHCMLFYCTIILINSFRNQQLEGDKEDELTHLLELHHEYDIVRQISMTKTAYYALFCSDRQLNDIEKFYCCNGILDPLAIDTTFNLCDFWLTDTSYCNRRLLVDTTGKSPVCFGPCMFHFKKDEEAFRRFALEICAGNPKLIN